jgi:hypothetical protein
MGRAAQRCGSAAWICCWLHQPPRPERHPVVGASGAFAASAESRKFYAGCSGDGSFGMAHRHASPANRNASIGFGKLACCQMAGQQPGWTVKKRVNHFGQEQSAGFGVLVEGVWSSNLMSPPLITYSCTPTGPWVSRSCGPVTFRPVRRAEFSCKRRRLGGELA